MTERLPHETTTEYLARVVAERRAAEATRLAERADFEAEVAAEYAAIRAEGRIAARRTPGRLTVTDAKRVAYDRVMMRRAEAAR